MYYNILCQYTQRQRQHTVNGNGFYVQTYMRTEARKWLERHTKTCIITYSYIRLD